MCSRIGGIIASIVLSGMVYKITFPVLLSNCPATHWIGIIVPSSLVTCLITHSSSSYSESPEKTTGWWFKYSVQISISFSDNITD
jgi:hypothetical protein